MKENFNYISCIKFLKKYVYKYKRNFIMFYFGTLFEAILALLLPVVLGIMIDEVVYYQDLNTFLKLTAFLIICCILSCGLYFLIYSQHAYLMNMFGFEIQKDIFSHLQKCNARYLSQMSTGEILTKLQDYPSQCTHFVIRNIIHIVNESFFVVLYGVYLLKINWKIGVISILAAPLATYINLKFKRQIREYGNQEREYYQGYLSWLLERLPAMCEIRILGAQRKVMGDFEFRQKKILDVAKKSKISTIVTQNGISFTSLVVRLSIYTVSSILVLDDTITVGMLTVILSFYEQLTFNIQKLSSRYLDLENRISYIEKIHKFFQTSTEETWNGKDELAITNGKIEFCNVSFSYKRSQLLLDKINLQINPGETIALVGKSGCGKTTLAYLLIGFYEPTEGIIKIDDQLLENCSLKSIREHVGIVQQQVLVFNGTIRENILLGNLHATENEIFEACEAAGMWEFIQSLPEGLDTKIGNEGSELSGGQKQRMAIARIYLKNPDIVILDEATSAVDSQTEQEILNSWKKTFSDKVSIVITHRENVARQCDRIIVIEDKKLRELF